MSHFTVGVFMKEGQTVEELLAPYQENNTGNCPKEYLRFYDVEEEYRKEYENNSVEMVKMPDGRLLYPWDKEFRVKGQFGYGSNTHKVPENYERIQVKFKDKYSDFDTFMKDWAGYENKDPETGKYGYWENPNAKWDWYQIGGRWQGMLLVKDTAKADIGEVSLVVGKGHEDKTPAPKGYKWVDSAKVKDIVWDKMQEITAKEREKTWEEAMDKEYESIREAYFGVKPGMTKEEYLNKMSMFSTFAVITPDGKWYEKGQMGWWAVVSNEEEDWDEKYKERFIDTADPEWTLTIVDCHI
jgi:hypothetical protein